jgi:hypothetical protein
MGYIILLCKFAPVQSMKSYAGVDFQLHWFLTQVLDVGKCSHLGRFTPTEVSTSAHRITERVDPRASLDVLWKRTIVNPCREKCHDFWEQLPPALQIYGSHYPGPASYIMY